MADEMDLIDYWTALVKRKRLIGIVVGAAFISSITISLVLPSIYSATARVLPPQQDNFGVPGFLSARAPEGVGGMAEGYLGQNSGSEVWAEILKCDTVCDAVIRRFGLINVFKADVIDDARKVLRGRTRITKTKVGVLSITVEDEDPKRAADIANAYVDELDNFNKNNVMATGASRRVFIETRLEETKLKLAQGEEALKKFQVSNGVVDIYSQTVAVIGSLENAKGLLMAKEVELRTLLSYAMPDNPQVKMLKSEVKGLRGELASLGRGRRGAVRAKDGDMFIPTSNFPGLSEQHARILRDLKLQEALYGHLVSQYEQSRIQEAKDSPVVQVMDRAQAPARRSKPRRGSIIVMTTSTAAILAVFLAFILERLESYRSRAVMEKLR